MKFLTSLVLFIARLCLAAIFISAGANKLIDYTSTYHYMETHGFTMIPFFLFGAAAIELLGGLALVLGCKIRWAAVILILFLIPTTIIFHSFWAASAGEAVMMRLFFFHNLAIIGGLLYVVCFGAGNWACGCRSCHCEQKPTAATPEPSDKYTI